MPFGENSIVTVTYTDLLELSAGEPDEIRFYGESPQQFGELWLPAGPGSGSVLVLIHGGCWQNSFDLSHVRPAATALRNRGHVVWSIEYRRIGDVGGGWPGTFLDVGAAVDHAAMIVRDRALATKNLIFMGHSAGGQLALWAASRPSFSRGHRFCRPEATIPDAVLALAAITDLQSYALGPSSCERAALELLGSAQEHASRYASASPRELLPTGIQTTLLYGDQDGIVPRSQAESFHRKARELGDRPELRCVSGAGHFDLIHPETKAWRTVISVLREFR
jgi:acetyl esterase/lipase